MEIVSARTTRKRLGARRQQPQHTRTDDGTNDLKQHVHACVLGAYPSAEEHAHRNGRVDVAPRDAANGVGHRYHGEAERQRRTEDCACVGRVGTVGRTIQADSHAAAHQDQHHRADHLS